MHMLRCRHFLCMRDYALVNWLEIEIITMFKEFIPNRKVRVSCCDYMRWLLIASNS